MVTLNTSNAYRSLVMLVLAVFWTALFWMALCRAPVLAQNADGWQQYSNLLKEYVQASESGRWDEAAQRADRLQAFVKRWFPQRLEAHGTVWVAQSRNGLGRYAEAIELYQQALTQCKEVRPQNKNEQTFYAVCVAESFRGLGVSLKELGRLKEAVSWLEESVKWCRQTNQLAVDPLTVLAFAYTEMGDYENAFATYRQLVATLEPLAARERTPGDRLYTLMLAVALSRWSSSLLHIGRYDQAEPLARRGLTLTVAVRGWQHHKTAEALNNLANVYRAQGRLAEAEPYYRAALQTWEASQGADHQSTATATMNLADIVDQQGRHVDAENLLRRAVAVFELRLGREHPRTAEAISDLAATLVRGGQKDEAERLLGEALAASEKTLGPTHEQTATTLRRLSLIKYQQGHLQEALRFLDRVAAIHERNPLNPMSVYHMHSLLATVLWKLGQQQPALDEMNKALAQAEICRAHTSGAERERATSFEQFGDDFEELIGWRAELDDVREMFVTMEAMKARSFLDELRLKNVDLSAGLPAAERRRLAERENELRRQISEAERMLAALPDPGPNPPPEFIGRRKQLVQSVLQARDALYQHLTEVRSSSPAYRELITDQTKPATLPMIQQLLGEDEVVFSYAIGSHQSHVVVIRKEDASYTALKVDEQTAAALNIQAGPLAANSLARLLLDEKQGVLPMIISPARHGEDASSRLAALWQVLIPESERAALMTGKVKLLTILPDGPLALLPFETLVVSKDSEPKYLLDVGPPIAYAPSAAVLLNLARREKTDPAAPRQLLTLGDPAYPPTAAPTQDTVDRKLGVTRSGDRFRAGLSRLPYTGWESTWVQQAFEKAGFMTVKLTGAGATEAAVRQHAAGREIVHLACHGMADQSYGNFFGALAIAPGKSGDSRDDGFCRCRKSTNWS